MKGVENAPLSSVDDSNVESWVVTTKAPFDIPQDVVTHFHQVFVWRVFDGFLQPDVDTAVFRAWDLLNETTPGRISILLHPCRGHSLHHSHWRRHQGKGCGGFLNWHF